MNEEEKKKIDERWKTGKAKNRKMYFVQGNYGSGWDDLTAHDTRYDAGKDLRDYNQNESYPHRIISRYIKREDYEKGNYKSGGKLKKGGEALAKELPAGWGGEMDRMLAMTSKEEQREIMRKIGVPEKEIYKTHPSELRAEYAADFYVELKRRREGYKKGGEAKSSFVPKSSQVKKLEKDIASLEASLDNKILSPDTKEKMRATIDAMKKQRDDMTKKISMKEKLDLEKGKYFLTIPAEYKDALYHKILKQGIKVKWSTLKGETKAIANNKSKLYKVYEAYSSILKKEKKEIPELETISGVM